MKHPGDTKSANNPPTANLKHDLRGILLPFPTPFRSNEEFDPEGLRANLRKWNRSGIVGYVALGSTGERVHLAEREYTQVIHIARGEVPQDLALLAGAGQQSTRGTIDEIKKAAAIGVDAALVITPSFYRPAITQEALVAHYCAVADESPIPVVLYSMPGLTGIKIEPQTTAELSTHENIVGIKDSSSDLAGFSEIVRSVAENFAVLTGNGTVLCDALGLGARGGILAVGCIAAAYCVEIYRLVKAGDRENAAVLQEKLTPLALAVTTRYGIGALKAAMDMIGFAGGSVRAPLQRPGDEAQREILGLLDALRAIELSKTEANAEFAGMKKP